MDLIAHIDGGSRGNPGPSAIGIVISDTTGTTIFETGEFVGHGTNNEAEYKALIRLLEVVATDPQLSKLKAKSLSVRCDSTLIVQQVTGKWKIKEPRMRELYEEVQRRKAPLKLALRIKAIPREENTHADRLVNQALDGATAGTTPSHVASHPDGIRF